MRDGIHPDYRMVAFRDTATGTVFRTRSTVSSDRDLEDRHRRAVEGHPPRPGRRRPGRATAAGPGPAGPTRTTGPR